MKKRMCFWAGGVFYFMVIAASLCYAGNGWESIGREMRNAKAVIIDPDDAKIIYLGTDRGLFKSQDSGKSWRNLFLSKAKSIGVNFILFDFANKDIIYAATDSGLFYSTNKGQKWDKIFKGKNNFEADCLAVAVLNGVIYLGTKQGLFVSRDKGRFWHKEKGKLGTAQIFNIVSFPENLSLLYLACSDGVFKSIDSGDSWERIFVSTPKDNEEEGDNEDEDQDEEIKYSDIRYLAADPGNPGYLFLATSRGIYQSKDGGISWETFPEYGLLSHDLLFVLCPKKSQLYSVSRSGIFTYRGFVWKELSLGLSFKKVNFIALDNNSNLYACLDSGLFRSSPGDGYRGTDILGEYFNNEPAIHDVQEAAIQYAEVSPEKITRWRKQAAKRAWLPKITVGMDRYKNSTVSKSIWGTSGTNSYDGKHYVGPDDETNYDNRNWGVSLTWELGDLIWNSSQTSIDVRSRLMVQLRDDILDEANKLYFERIRVKAELDSLSLEEKKKRFEKELRLRELTASIDALTGGFFSQQLSKNTI
jgi:ligand-binding sensor domain-containing protein